MFNFKFRKLSVLILLLLVIGLSFSTSFDSRIKSYFYSLSEPIQGSFKMASNETSGWIETIFSFRELEREKERLKKERNELLNKNSELNYLRKENEELRKALELELQKEFELSLAQVRGKDPDQEEIVIGKGGNDGVERGMPVINSQKVVLGQIQEVHRNFSRVRLISHPESSFSAEIKGTEITGKVQGEKGSLLFDFIPQNQEVRIGEVVTTSSLGRSFPRSLLVGKIKDIQKYDVESFQKAEIDPFFNFEDLFVFVITNY